MVNRKPTFLRWLEEAEAKQVCEWAELEHASDQPEVCDLRSLGSRDRASLLDRLRGLFGSQTGQIGRDD